MADIGGSFPEPHRAIDQELCRLLDYAEWEFDKLPERHSVKAAPRFTGHITRHSFSLLQAFEESQELIIRAITPRFTFDRYGLGQDVLLHLEVCLEVNLRGLHRFMPEPKRNHCSIHAGLQQFHGGGVPKDMR